MLCEQLMFGRLVVQVASAPVQSPRVPCVPRSTVHPVQLGLIIAPATVVPVQTEGAGVACEFSAGVPPNSAPG